MSEEPARPVLVTGNASKLREARRLLPGLEALDLDLPEIQSLDLDEVLRHKGREASRRVGGPVIVEETGLELEALKGFPGPLVKWMLEAVGPDGIARIVGHEDSQRARAVCALLFTDGEREIIAHGATTGRLVLPPRGDQGFGWDPVFQPDESTHTYGEMSPEEKDAISHRGRAWRAFAAALDEESIEIKVHRGVRSPSRREEVAMEDLRFPLGRFEFPPDLTAERDSMIEQIEYAPREFRQAAAGLDDAQLDTPYRPGGWTIRQVVHHVADSHLNSYMRFKLAVTEDNPEVKLYDEKLWAELEDGKTAPVEVSLALLDALHERWARFLRSLDERQFLRTFRHPDFGELTVEQNIAIYAWHGRHHVAHVTGLRQRQGWS